MSLMRRDDPRCATRLLGLKLDRLLDSEGPSRLIPNFDFPATFEVRGNDAWLRPVQIPSVLDGQQCVGAGNYASQSKSSVQIALISAEEISAKFRIFRHQTHHPPRKASPRPRHGSLNLRTPSRERKRN